MRLSLLFIFLISINCTDTFSQVDTSFIYSSSAPYGMLDIRLSKGHGHTYYLQHGKTYSFRENNGVRTDTYYKMTAWDSRPYTEGNMRERKDRTDLFVMNYRLLAPSNYDAAHEKGYPIMIVMHGLHERGNCADNDCYFATRDYSPNENVPAAPEDPYNKLLNNDFQLVHAGSDYLEASDVNGSRFPDDPSLPSGAFPGFVVFPQNLNGWDVNASHDVIRLIRLLVKHYNIDQDAIYLNGISHGGHGAYEVLKRAPWMFAAAALFSAADDASLITQKMAREISTIPLWIFQGGLDTSPSPAKTAQYVAAFRKAGAEVRYTLYPHLGHGTWNEALDEPDYFRWMLSKRRNNIHVEGGTASICLTSRDGARLRLPAGFLSYQWEYNGVAVENANTHLLVAEEPGVYRARFLVSHKGASFVWSNWSDKVLIKEGAPAAPLIEHAGTLLLPDPNGNQDAVLQAMDDYPYYYWYKDGKLIRSGEISDTSQTFYVKSRMGNGAYSLRVSGYDRCKSPESAVKMILFNDTAPVDLSAPSDLKASVVSPSEVSLQWSATSAGEIVFEVWRRSTGADGKTSAWTLAGLAQKNARAFADRGLAPATQYHYTLRAVSHVARSLYTMEGGAGEIIVKTPEDNEKPSAPRNLSVRQAGVNTVRLNWSPSTDNASITNYIIVYSGDSVHTNSADTVLLLSALEVNTEYAFEVHAADRSGNISPASNTAYANTFLEGLYYQHSTGAWEDIEMIDWSVAEFSGVVDDFTLSPKTQEDFFNFQFDGFLNIEKGGVYQFRVTSDDGSVLHMNDSILIENDGIHNISTVTSPVTILESGPQRITLRYFDYVLSDTLLVEYKGPDSGGSWSKIPSEALASARITGNEPTHQHHLDFSVYPNPVAHGNVHLEFFGAINGPVTVTIMNTTGSTVYETVIEVESNDVILPSLPEAGMYIISVRQGVSVVNRKIVSRR